jgi:hypothetical protein
MISFSHQQLLRVSCVHSAMPSSTPGSSFATTSSHDSRSPPSQTQHEDVETLEKSEPLSLNDLPAEIIDDIAHHVRSRRQPQVPFCRCRSKKSKPFNLSTAPFKKFSDPSWAFSCASKRYREIVFHGNKSRTYGLCYSRCCIEKALDISEEIRASVT